MDLAHSVLSLSTAAAVASIKVDFDGHRVVFKMKKTSKMGKMMRSFCADMKIDPKSVRFYLDGRRILPDEKVGDLGDLDSDHSVVEVYSEQEGGGGGGGGGGEEA